MIEYFDKIQKKHKRIFSNYKIQKKIYINQIKDWVKGKSNLTIT